MFGHCADYASELLALTLGYHGYAFQVLEEYLEPPLMRLLPVIDLLGGQVVHAVRGQRSAYRPIQSQLCTTAEPADVARAYAELGLTEVYIADLDAIAGRPPQWPALRAIRQQGLQLWLDAGLATVITCQEFMQQLAAHDLPNTVIVIGLESWRTPSELGYVPKVVGSDRVVFSIDLRGGVPIGGHAWPKQPLEVARLVVDQGITSLLVLDLAHVGSDEGPATIHLCQQIRSTWPGIQLASGGGIRNREDCQQLMAAGCHRVLVATALHQGKLTEGLGSLVEP